MRLAGPMTREICGGDVGDGLWVDVDDLEVNAVSMMDEIGTRGHGRKTEHTLLRSSSSCEGTRGAMMNDGLRKPRGNLEEEEGQTKWRSNCEKFFGGSGSIF